MKTSLILSTLLSIFTLTSAYAVESNAPANDPYLSIQSVEITDISNLTNKEIAASMKAKLNHVEMTNKLWYSKSLAAKPSAKGKDAITDLIDDIDLAVDSEIVGRFLKVGKGVWNLIKEGEPSATLKLESLSVLPEEVTKWHQMEYWKTPKAKTFQVSYKNGFGMEVINFTYSLQFAFGGKFDGKGQYLSNIRVNPLHIKVLWGFDLNADFHVLNIQNSGSLDEPVPAVEVAIEHNVDTIFKKSMYADVFYMKGNGELTKIK